MPVPIISGPYKTFRPVLSGHSFVEYEGSTITIPLTVKMKDGTLKTTPIQLEAFMRLEVFPAYINGLGTREFQFIIRDWELFGYSELLNELFYGDPLGRDRGPGFGGIANPLDNRRREIAAMTFTLSRNFFKYDDNNNANLAPVEGVDPDTKVRTQLLQIDNLTSHDFDDNFIYWQIEPGKDNGMTVLFHSKRASQGKVQKIALGAAGAKGVQSIMGDDRKFLLARAEVAAADPEKTLRAGDEFVATLTEEEHSELIVTPSEGNSTVSKLIKPRRPVTIRWRLGENPQPGATGRIRIVSPAKSICTAHQGPSVGEKEDSVDFPARIMYAASYHIYINNQRFVEDQAGVALADGVHEIPPRDVTVAFDKPHAGHVLERYLEFGPGHCTGMHEIPVDRYMFGKNTSEYWRTQPLNPV